MNVLMLTPDAVGSTLLQRLITIYMQLHEYDRPVINLHELTNGLHKYYSPEFNRELLGKKNDKWGYHQSLQEIVTLLDGADHYKTSRLAQYHIKSRQDTVEQQVPFYRYLDDNFFVISCRRRNLFEHAISWVINGFTKKLNVYSQQEKIDTFFGLYQNQFEVTQDQLSSKLHTYKEYIDWSNNNFSIGSYFYYEDHLPQIERYILDLPMFAGQKNRVTWNDTYGIDFAEWNRCHFYGSDLGALALERPAELLQIADASKPLPWMTEKSSISYNLIADHLPVAHKEFMYQHAEQYVQARESIQHMVKLGILVTAVPIKKQTLAEKMYLVKNIDQCIDFYNQWVEHNPGIAEPVTRESLQGRMEVEREIWNPAIALTTDSTVEPLALPPSQL
jgi:hypothetical protein